MYIWVPTPFLHEGYQLWVYKSGDFVEYFVGAYFPLSVILSLLFRLLEGHNTLTSRELMWCYACSWDVRGDLSLNSMAQIHTSVTLLTSHDFTWSSGRLTCQHASHISVVAHISWDVTSGSICVHILTTIPASQQKAAKLYVIAFYALWQQQKPDNICVSLQY
jgi:hypothetical protein